MTARSKDFRYLDDRQIAILQDHTEEYPTGANTRVYFENIPVTEVNGMAWREMQNFSPRYDYASYKPNAILYGNRIVQGTISLAFRDAQYMGDLLMAVNYQLEPRPEGPRAYLDDEETAAAANPYDVEPSTLLDIDSFIDAVIGTQDSSGRRAGWRVLADAMDRQVFGQERYKSVRSVQGSDIPRFRPEHLGAANVRLSHILSTGFTIYIVYNSNDLWYNELRSGRLGGTSKRYMDLGDAPVEYAYDGGEQGTVRVISGVRIVAGPDQEMDMSGTPAQEIYTFVAEDIDLVSIPAQRERIVNEPTGGTGPEFWDYPTARATT
jgi:hypothetical protein